jgi:hypothetical protein
MEEDLTSTTILAQMVSFFFLYEQSWLLVVYANLRRLAWYF